MKRIYSINDLWCGVLLWLCLILTLWVYWPGLAGPSILDDGVNLQGLAILEESTSYVVDVIKNNDSGPLGRPVSMLSFALTKLFTDGSVWWFKYHNLQIHLIIGCLVAWFSLLIFRAWQLEQASIAAVLVAALWLWQPLFVSTVLYPVQRMAQLSVLFILTGLISYCYCRLFLINKTSFLRILISILVVLPSFILAIYAKENGACLPLLILVVEAYVFSFHLDSEESERWFKCLCLRVALPLAVLLFLFAAFHYSGSYESRDFNIQERLLTESRILWLYAKQLVMPDITIMGVNQDDIEISRSLLSPVSTLWALISWLAALCLIIFFRGKQYRVIAFAAAFYLISHLIESSVVPLELYFEHRSYLGAISLIMLLVFYAMKIVSFWFLNVLFRLICIALIVWLPINTSALAQVWSSSSLRTFYEYNGHPKSVRSNSDMAMFFAKNGYLDQALVYSRTVHELKDKEQDFEYVLRDLSLACLADNSNIDPILKRMTVNKDSIKDGQSNELMYKLAQDIQDQRCNKFPVALFVEAIRANIINSDFVIPEKIFASMVVIENSKGHYKEALEYAEQWLQRKIQDQAKPLLMAVYFAILLEDLEKTGHYLALLEELRVKNLLSLEQVDDLDMFNMAASKLAEGQLTKGSTQ